MAAAIFDGIDLPDKAGKTFVNQQFYSTLGETQ
jgi:hypothetical protein